MHSRCESLQFEHVLPEFIALSPRGNDDQSSAIRERLKGTFYCIVSQWDVRRTKFATHTLLPAARITGTMQTSLLQFLSNFLEFVREIVVLVGHVDPVRPQSPNIRRGVYPKSCVCRAGRCWLVCSSQSQILHRTLLQQYSKVLMSTKSVQYYLMEHARSSVRSNQYVRKVITGCVSFSRTIDQIINL